MADVFIEQIVKRKLDVRQVMVRLSIILGGLVLSVAALLFFSAAFPIVLAVSCYFGYLFVKRQSWEYEYAVTNGELDVDRIMGRNARKRVVTVSCGAFDVFYPMNKDYADEYNSKTIRKVIDAASSANAPGRWFAIFQGKDNLRTMLVFEPDERMLDAIKAALPRRLQRR